MTQTIMNDTNTRMQKTLEKMNEEFKSIRTGRATPGLVENIKVDCYGSFTPIKQLASIATPEAQLIVISPYDPSTLKDIDKAISQTEQGLTTNTDGKVIRISVPPLSGDRRTQIVAQLKEMTEEAKTSIRNIRRDANKQVDGEEKSSKLTEDEAKKAKDQIQKATHENEATLNDMLAKKTAEILKV